MLLYRKCFFTNTSLLYSYFLRLLFFYFVQYLTLALQIIFDSEKLVYIIIHLNIEEVQILSIRKSWWGVFSSLFFRTFCCKKEEDSKTLSKEYRRKGVFVRDCCTAKDFNFHVSALFNAEKAISRSALLFNIQHSPPRCWQSP